jgi:hypothetical protein
MLMRTRRRQLSVHKRHNGAPAGHPRDPSGVQGIRESLLFLISTTLVLFSSLIHPLVSAGLALGILGVLGVSCLRSEQGRIREG